MAPKKQKSALSEDLVVQPKKFDPAIAALSVVDTPAVGENATPRTPLMFFLASAADAILPWGVDVAARDKQLRDFYPTEPTLSSAVYSVSARNASFEWDIVPADPRTNPRNTILAEKRILNNVQNGKGFEKLMLKTSIDLYTQDNGAFWEHIRAVDDPSAPVLSVNHLDAARCTRTGDPKNPVLYQDRRGKYHTLKAYQVTTFEEMPSPIEEMYDVQLCAVSRALRLAQILRSIMVYKDEKVSGRNARAIDFVSGVSLADIADAQKLADEMANNRGMARFATHVLIPGLDPEHPVSTERIDLASLPDNFDFDQEMKWYIAILAMAFGVDYQEFAPLASGAMGSSSQSDVLHMKTHGKGPAMWMSMITHAFNNGILARTVQLKFKAQDANNDEKVANARYLRGRDRSLRVSSGEMDDTAARQLAQEDGDLPTWIAEDMEERGADQVDSTEELPDDGNAGQMPDDANAGKMPQETENTARQIEGGQQTAPKQYGRGGMRAIKPSKKPQAVTEDDVKREKRKLRKRLDG